MYIYTTLNRNVIYPLRCFDALWLVAIESARKIGTHTNLDALERF